MSAVWEFIRQFTPWRRKPADTEALYKYLWDQPQVNVKPRSGKDSV